MSSPDAKKQKTDGAFKGTPHINAKIGDFAEVVLLPGDPKRAKFIADTFLTDVKQVTDVRSMLGFTGTYKGQRISVMGTGMGVPSIGIYATELVKFYGVKVLIRVGTCGTVLDHVKVGDVCIGQAAATDSSINHVRYSTRRRAYDVPPIADFGLCRLAVESAEKRKCKFHVGNIFSTDTFYNTDEELNEMCSKYNILAYEMEAASLYGIAAEYNAKALAICTVSDHITAGVHLTPEERTTKVTTMCQIAFDVAETASQMDF